MNLSERLLMKVNEVRERAEIRDKIKAKANTIAVHILLLKYANAIYVGTTQHWLKELYNRYYEIKESIKNKRMVDSTVVRQFLWEKQWEDNFLSDVVKEVVKHGDIQLPEQEEVSNTIDNAYSIIAGLTEDDATFDEFVESINMVLEIN